MTDLILTDNEKLVKTYGCISGGRDGSVSKTSVTVTTKRIVKTVAGPNNESADEFNIAGVCGFSSSASTARNLFLAVIGALIALAGFIFMIYVIALSIKWENFIASQFFLTFIPMAVGTILILIGIIKRHAASLTVYFGHAINAGLSVGANPGSISFNRSKLKLLFTVKFGRTVLPDMRLMMRELPVLVRDIQTTGERAVEKWSNQTSKKDIDNIHRNK